MLMKQAFHRLGTVLVFILTIALVVGCSSQTKGKENLVVLDALESPLVMTLKEMPFEGTEYALGAIVDASMVSTTYEHLNPASDGNVYLRVKGKVMYQGTDVVAKIEYRENGQSGYVFHKLTLDESDQSVLAVGDFFNFLLEQYKGDHLSEAEAPSDVEWAFYSNARYGFEIAYPLSWGEAFESGSGDGAVLLMEGLYDVRAYASYLVTEPNFESYIGANYEGWEISDMPVEGADKAYLLEYFGEAYQFAVVAISDDTVYTYLAVRMFPFEEMTEAEEMLYTKTGELTEQMIQSFKIY